MRERQIYIEVFPRNWAAARALSPERAFAAGSRKICSVPPSTIWSYRCDSIVSPTVSARRDGWLAGLDENRATGSLSLFLPNFSFSFRLPPARESRYLYISDRDSLIARARAANALFSARPRHLDDMVVELSRFYLVSVPPCSFLSCCCAAPTSLYLSLYLTVVAFLRFSPATTSVRVYANRL